MFGKILTKTIGIAAIGLAGHDILSTTKVQAKRSARLSQLKRINDVYLRTDSLDTESRLANNLQNWSRKWHLEDNWFYRTKDSITGYISSFVDNVGQNFSTLGMGLVALLCGKGRLSPIKIPVIGKLAAIGLSIKAGFYVLRDLFGIGSISERNKYNF